MAQVKQRLHQGLFRARVLRAYGGRCALTGLPEARLVDAAHIIPDGDKALGQPDIRNGICMSKIHHAAFDANLAIASTPISGFTFPGGCSASTTGQCWSRDSRPGGTADPLPQGHGPVAGPGASRSPVRRIPAVGVTAGMTPAIGWYERNAGPAAELELDKSLAFESLYGWLIGLGLPPGAGRDPRRRRRQGRDAGWLAARGYEVVAAEPSAAMRSAARARHAHARIRWIDDRLPGLEETIRLGIAFDLILASAVWMHVPPDQRSRAFRKLVLLLKPGGVLALTLRHGPADPERAMHGVSAGEIETLARAHGAAVEWMASAPDRLCWPEVGGPRSCCACRTTVPAPCRCCAT